VKSNIGGSDTQWFYDVVLDAPRGTRLRACLCPREGIAFACNDARHFSVNAGEIEVREPDRLSNRSFPHPVSGHCQLLPGVTAVATGARADWPYGSPGSVLDNPARWPFALSVEECRALCERNATCDVFVFHDPGSALSRDGVVDAWDGACVHLSWSQMEALGADAPTFAEFVEAQSIPTLRARDSHFFEIGGRELLAVANSEDPDSSQYTIASKIYQWNGASFGELQSIITKNAQAVHSFEIAGDRYLALANHLDESISGPSQYEIDSKVYKWNVATSRFVEFQSIPTIGAMGWHSFEIDGVTYLAVANFGRDSASGDNRYNRDSKVYKWDVTMSTFVEFQSFPTNGAHDWESFEIGGVRYLAVANFREGGNFDIDSKIYKWDVGTEIFLEFQIIPTSGARDWEFFEIGGERYLAVANAQSGGGGTLEVNIDSKVYKWNEALSRFVEFQSIRTASAIDWEFFEIGGEPYLALANVFDGTSQLCDSKIYKWNGTAFAEFQSVPTAAARDWEFFEMGGEPYLAVANGKDGVTGFHSKVYTAAASARALASGNHPRHASGSGGRTSAYERRELQAAGGISSALVDLNSSELNSPRAARARDGLGDGDNPVLEGLGEDPKLLASDAVDGPRSPTRQLQSSPVQAVHFDPGAGVHLNISTRFIGDIYSSRSSVQGGTDYAYDPFWSGTTFVHCGGAYRHYADLVFWDVSTGDMQILSSNNISLRRRTFDSSIGGFNARRRADRHGGVEDSNPRRRHSLFAGGIAVDGKAYCFPSAKYDLVIFDVADTRLETTHEVNLFNASDGTRLPTWAYWGFPKDDPTAFGLQWSGVALVGTRLFATPALNKATLVFDVVTEHVSAIPAPASEIDDIWESNCFSLNTDPEWFAKWQGAAAIGTRVYGAPYLEAAVLVVDASNDTSWTNWDTDTLCPPLYNSARRRESYGYPRFSGITAVGTKLYMSPFFSKCAIVVDTATSTVASIDTEPYFGWTWTTTHGYPLAFNPFTLVGTRLYATPRGADNLLIIDTATDTVAAAVPVPSPNGPRRRSPHPTRHNPIWAGEYTQGIAVGTKLYALGLHAGAYALEIEILPTPPPSPFPSPSPTVAPTPFPTQKGYSAGDATSWGRNPNVTTGMLVGTSSSHRSCPARCGECLAGSADDGGVALNDGGTCEEWCSEKGFCGGSDKYINGYIHHLNGQEYGPGTDCRGCMKRRQLPWSARSMATGAASGGPSAPARRPTLPARGCAATSRSWTTRRRGAAASVLQPPALVHARAWRGTTVVRGLTGTRVAPEASRSVWAYLA
jgi:YVTN family beta-propeller protein